MNKHPLSQSVTDRKNSVVQYLGYNCRPFSWPVLLKIGMLLLLEAARKQAAELNTVELDSNPKHHQIPNT